ncbi:hypothetical protein I4510_04830 [Klebsiella pneumoniae]|uniref:KAP NTPase domain-containing protein n=12 Tax=Klebsiella pneumoniae TaxID=573 RepID=A0A486UI33_KLEPN|nr:P-loop NTPase fold protein [Klebsiella pneumoniae]HDT0764809.1 hypothetical protein [Klebsiella pneumoniae subsp. pneumoniae]EKU2607769.1 hypothetical protein [Klebsiella pneumoniae]EKU3915315.1 hypothetical protein [Klebsiella pneumoniae]EKU3931351.1 hypothetical protein [Klebsiella pneumoniae]EKX7970540.1 hypothetical protein [Klebsiella pneumoniae]
MINLEQSLEAFVKSEHRVMVIKGDWGVGKTYAWNKYIETHGGSLTQIAYCYISLFGKNSLQDIKKSIFHSAKAISSKEQVENEMRKQLETASSLFNHVPWLKDNLFVTYVNQAFFWIKKAVAKIGVVSRHADSIPYVNKALGVVSTLEYALVNNYIICFDDLERKGNGLSVKDIMGLIDELAQRKNCKIILVFNEDSLSDENDKKTFKEYREKIVDLELKYDPVVKDNFDCVFAKSYSDYECIFNVSDKLNIRNIRVLKKIRNVINSFEPFLSDADNLVRNEFVLHVTLLCWSYYTHLDDLSYEEFRRLLRDKSWLSFAGKKENEYTSAEKLYASLASSLNFRKSVFDDEIDFFIKNGYVRDRNGFRDIISQKNNEAKISRLEERIQQAWSIYHGSFVDNKDTFIEALVSILDCELNDVDVRSFDSMISILQDFNYPVESYIKKYSEILGATRDFSDARSRMILRDIRSKPLREKINELIEGGKNHTIDEVAEALMKSNGWDSDVIDYLSQVSVEELVGWMKSNPIELIDKIRYGLLKFSNVQSSDPKYSIITENVTAALKIIASENDFNRFRIENMFGIKLDGV